ncbi:MAG: type II secretion system secretin GspD [Acidobacteria bacterium]|nr:type II secretion system secretin GspD [Acidobacteriota bacterium]
MKGKWIKTRIRKRISTGSSIWTTGIVIFYLLSPAGLAAWQQEGDVSEQENRENASPQPEEEFVEVEKQTPFGIQRYRVPRSSLPQQQEQSSESQPASVENAPTAVVPVPPAASAEAAQQPAALAVQQETPPAATPAPQASQASPAVPIALHLENAELLQVIGIIAAELQMNYVVDPQVQGTVNINTLGQLYREDLFPLLQMILRINGATAVQTGNFFRIVPLQDVQRLPLEPLINPTAADLPLDDRMVMNIVPLQYVSAADMTRILTPFLSAGGHLFSQEQGNILMITDSSRSMRRLLELVGLFDSEVFTGQRARLYPVTNSEAGRLAEELEDVFSAYALSGEAAVVRFVPIERINSILAVTSSPGLYPEVQKWIDRLDQPFRESGIRNFIYKVENAKAEDLATVLSQLHGSIPYPQAGLAGTGAAPIPGTASLFQGGAMQPQLTIPGGNFPGMGFAALSHIRIVPDPVNNQLVIQATAQEYEQIRQTLRDLDIIPRQVMIEAKVYEVDLTGALSAGVSAFLQNRSNAERKPLGSFATALDVSVGTLIGKTRELLFFLNAAELRSQARVISAPSLLVSDNVTASISVGTEIPILTSRALVGGGQVGGTSLFTNTIQNRDTGILLNITPRINSSGLVNLQINQEVSAPIAPLEGGIQSPSIQKRSIQTQVVVQDGETIAIGGIIQETRTLSTNRIPLLGRIPYLGILFGSTSLSSQKTELIILVTPTVIRNSAEARRATTELRDKLKELQRILQEEKEAKEEKEKERQEENSGQPQPSAPQEQNQE